MIFDNRHDSARRRDYPKAGHLKYLRNPLLCLSYFDNMGFGRRCGSSNIFQGRFPVDLILNYSYRFFSRLCSLRGGLLLFVSEIQSLLESLNLLSQPFNLSL